MRYQRFIPRDLFNEASLLKCYGRVYVALEKCEGHTARFAQDQVSEFEIVQVASDGSLFIANLPLMIGDDEYRLMRPLNSRRPWPLYAERFEDPEFEPVPVFDDHGEFTEEMRALLTANQPRPR